MFDRGVRVVLHVRVVLKFRDKCPCTRPFRTGTRARKITGGRSVKEGLEGGLREKSDGVPLVHLPNLLHSQPKQALDSELENPQYQASDTSQPGLYGLLPIHLRLRFLGVQVP